MKILVVDDELDICELLQYNLETEGYEVAAVNSAEEARDGRLNLLTCFDDEVKVELGQPSQEAGQAALMALDRAMTEDLGQRFYIKSDLDCF